MVGVRACANGCGDKAKLKVKHALISRPLYICSIKCALEWFGRHGDSEGGEGRMSCVGKCAAVGPDTPSDVLKGVA